MLSKTHLSNTSLLLYTYLFLLTDTALSLSKLNLSASPAEGSHSGLEWVYPEHFVTQSYRKPSQSKGVSISLNAYTERQTNHTRTLHGVLSTTHTDVFKGSLTTTWNTFSRTSLLDLISTSMPKANTPTSPSLTAAPSLPPTTSCPPTTTQSISLSGCTSSTQKSTDPISDRISGYINTIAAVLAAWYTRQGILIMQRAQIRNPQPGPNRLADAIVNRVLRFLVLRRAVGRR